MNAKRPKRPWKVWTLQVMGGGERTLSGRRDQTPSSPWGFTFQQGSDLGDIKRGTERGEA